jgi:hypothetical protein
VFEEGDEIRHKETGATGVVTCQCNDGDGQVVSVEWLCLEPEPDGASSAYCFDTANLELKEDDVVTRFQVGDRVKPLKGKWPTVVPLSWLAAGVVTSDKGPPACNGTVIEVAPPDNEDDRTRYLVCFDRPMHGHGDFASEWYCYDEWLTPENEDKQLDELSETVDDFLGEILDLAARGESND